MFTESATTKDHEEKKIEKLYKIELDESRQKPRLIRKVCIYVSQLVVSRINITVVFI